MTIRLPSREGRGGEGRGGEGRGGEEGTCGQSGWGEAHGKWKREDGGKR